jgi:hypothetical protein
MIMVQEFLLKKNGMIIVRERIFMSGKTIKEGIEEIASIKRLTNADLESLIRWTAWVNRDAKELLKSRGKI